MNRRRLPARIALACLMALAVAGGAAGQEAPAQKSGGPGVRIDFDIHPLMMCHYYLKTYGETSTRPGADSGVDFAAEAKAYSDALRLTTNAAVWRWFEERIAAGKSPADVKKATAELPASIRGDDSRKAVDLLAQALESAFPKYEKSVFAKDLAGLNRVLVGAKKRYLRVKGRIAEALMKQMAFEPVERPIKVLVVVRRGSAVWGTNESSHFTIIESFGRSPMSLIESGLHEATHVIDALQSFSSDSVLARVRRDGDQKNKDEVETFLHGLVAFNAGELVKRFLSSAYVHADVQSPEVLHEYRPYLSTYEYIWTSYMDGKMTTEGVAKKLIEEYDAVQRLYPAKKEG